MTRQVYCLGKINFLTLDLNESRQGFNDPFFELSRHMAATFYVP